MFFLLVCSLFIIPFILPKHGKYEIKTIEAVSNGTNITLVHYPQDLPENIDFFIMTIANGHDTRKIGRQSVTVPNSMRVSPKFHLHQAILLHKSGTTEEIQDVLRPYVGYTHNFDHHEVSLHDILTLEGFNDLHSISCMWSENSLHHFFQKKFLTITML
jgi:hypothetical protein